MLSAIFIKSNLKCQFFVSISICTQIIPSAPNHSRVSRRHQLLSPNLLPLFNSPSPATAQKPLPSIRHICGLGASVGCERIERTFNTPRLNSQICLIGGNGFVCSFTRVCFSCSLRDRLFCLLIIDLSQISVYSCLRAGKSFCNKRDGTF